MEWSWQPKVMVVSFLSALIKTLSLVPQFLSFCLRCLVVLLAGMLAGCAGKHSKSTTGNHQTSVEEGPTTTADQRLREAIRYYMGTYYRYGGTSKEGLDCSGFVMAAYERPV